MCIIIANLKPSISKIHAKCKQLKLYTKYNIINQILLILSKVLYCISADKPTPPSIMLATSTKTGSANRPSFGITDLESKSARHPNCSTSNNLALIRHRQYVRGELTVSYR